MNEWGHMRVLLDTNIVVHRENHTVSNYSIGHLFRWLDKLNFTKIIHPFTIQEIEKYNDDEDRLHALQIKLESYEKLQTIAQQTAEFIDTLAHQTKDSNDEIDNALLFETLLGKVDIFITEDRGIHRKAAILNIADKVYTINRFISLVTTQNPELVDYKMLAVKKKRFGELNLSAEFFDSFRRDYPGFDTWFIRKCDEIAYVCEDDSGDLLGFLYIKVEEKDENYSDIIPTFERKRRLKIGTFKVESTGFRLGERFLKIIFDNAIQYDVREIYVTIFDERDELNALSSLLKRWGFSVFGTKTSGAGIENVLVKELFTFDNTLSPKVNFPNLDFNNQKFILPILPCYHTTLLPDSILRTENEVNFLGNAPHRYALQKAYISFSPEREIYPGDLVMFYRMGDGVNKKYSSVLTTLGVIDEVHFDFATKDEFFAQCQNRTVFTNTELESFWRKRRGGIVVKFIHVKSFEKRITLGELWDSGIISPPNGPRPFTRITDDQFNFILHEAETDVNIFV